MRAVIPLEPGDELAVNIVLPSVAISPDGQSVAYVVKRGDSTQIYLRALHETEAKLLDTTERVGAPFFSPDGQMDSGQSPGDVCFECLRAGKHFLASGRR